MLVPELALAPVIEPVIVPIVQLKVLVGDAIKLIFGPSPLQVLKVLAVITVGIRFTVMVTEFDDAVVDAKQAPPVMVISQVTASLIFNAVDE